MNTDYRPSSRPDPLIVSDDLQWLHEATHGLVPGGVYLLAGSPGIGKSTLALQLAISRAMSGFPTLYLLTEQSPDEAQDRAYGILQKMNMADSADAVSDEDTQASAAKAQEALSLIRFQEAEPTAESLARSWSQGRGWAGTSGRQSIQLVMLDSVQGNGLSASSKSYKIVLNFAKMLKDEHVVAILLSHITKDGKIAGPKTLEHAVDCVLVMRKAMSYRPLFITKNRFGTTPNSPIPLILSKKTTGLAPSPHKKAMVAVAKAIIPRATDFCEAQVNIALPKSLDQKGKISAVGIPKKIIEQLISSISFLVDPDLADLDFSIQCNVAGAGKYSQYICFAMAMAIFASYIRKEIPSTYYYVGEIDLQGHVRQMSVEVVELGSHAEWRFLRNLPDDATVFCSADDADRLKYGNGHFSNVNLIGCTSVKDAIRYTWPDVLDEE